MNNIKSLIIPGVCIFEVGKVSKEIHTSEPIEEIKPYYSNCGIPYLYNLISKNGNVLASIQSVNLIIKY